MKRALPPVIYYSDELSDEFSTAQLTPIAIDAHYDYGNNSLRWRFLHFLYYRVLATALAVPYLQLTYRHKIVNRKVIKPYQKGAFFIYGNHTNAIADALIPTFVSWPKHTYVIVHANNVSIPGLGQSTRLLGALPLPDDREATKHFMDILRLRVQTKKSIAIYPEAHIWPYYTKIRPFGDASFRFPVQYKAPVFCFTNTYQKRRFSHTPRLVTYVDGPFFADESLSPKAQRADLRRRVYEAMTARSKLNTVELIRYEQKPAAPATAQEAATAPAAVAGTAPASVSATATPAAAHAPSAPAQGEAQHD